MLFGLSLILELSPMPPFKIGDMLLGGGLQDDGMGIPSLCHIFLLPSLGDSAPTMSGDSERSRRGLRSTTSLLLNRIRIHFTRHAGQLGPRRQFRTGFWTASWSASTQWGPPPPGLSAEGAARELLATKDLYSQEPKHLAPFDLTKLYN